MLSKRRDATGTLIVCALPRVAAGLVSADAKPAVSLSGIEGWGDTRLPPAPGKRFASGQLKNGIIFLFLF